MAVVTGEHAPWCPARISSEATCGCRRRLSDRNGSWPFIRSRVALELWGAERLSNLVHANVLEVVPGGYQLREGMAIR